MKEIKRFTIDFSNVSGYINNEHEDILKATLRKNKIFGKSFLYTVFDLSSTQYLLSKGSYRPKEPDIIFAFNHKQLNWNLDQDQSLKIYQARYDLPGLIIWDASSFTQSKELLSKGKLITDYAYAFRNPKVKLEAITGIGEFIF